LRDVAVIGGGVVGLACARELSLAGARVVVLEALDAVGQASSSRANGGVRAQFTTAPNIAFSLFSIGAYEELAERSPEIGFHQSGYLLLAGEERSEASLRAASELQRSMGVRTEWLEPGDVASLAPFARLEGLRGATFHARDGFLDPAGAVTALAREARERGAQIRTGALVVAASRQRSRVELELTSGEHVDAAVVVNAAGADAAEVSVLLGATELPVAPVRRNLAMFLDPEPRVTPMCVDLDTGVLARREVGGGWVVAYSNPDDPPSRDITFDPAFLEQLAERIGNRFPFLEELPVDPARCWAGLYPETPDHHSIVGVDPVASDVIHCAGFGGHGVMHAPAAGRAVAELVATARSTTFDLHPLRPERFADDDLVVETNVF
jgi:sarcosine oxidase subunit beta